MVTQYMDQSITDDKVSPPFMKKIKERLYRWMRLTSLPVVKVYQGYGNGETMVVFGHVLGLSPLPRKRYRRNVWTNTLALLRLFMVRPLPGVEVELWFDGELRSAVTERDGFFRFQWNPPVMPAPGWHTVEVSLHRDAVKSYYGRIRGQGAVFVAYPGKYAVISDIDDTFLISYSTNLRKRLYVLLTENAYSRKPFEGVVRHYQWLELAGTRNGYPNPFFYVSSSEWNLYDYITDFSTKNLLPRGVYLLNQTKSFAQIWRTGQNNHATKFMRITRVIQAFPGRGFILLGDDSQQDPFIYASVVAHFPGRVRAVYLRNIHHKNRQAVQAAIDAMQAAGVPVCHFIHSHDAIKHSQHIGLISL